MDNLDTNRDKIALYIKGGEKRKEDFALGLEEEHFLVDAHGALDYEKTRDVLLSLKEFFPKEVYVDSYLLGLEGKDSYLTLEPACQFEFSLTPKKTLGEIVNGYNTFLKNISPILASKDIAMVPWGYLPKGKAEDRPLIKKFRYEKMNEYLSKKGTMAKNMMRATCATQVSIDYENEKDFALKMRVATILSPILAFWMDNCRIYEGALNSKRMLRTLIWQNTDNDRSGACPGVFEEDFSYKKYADALMNVPLIVAQDKQGALNYVGEATANQIYKDEVINEEQLEHILSMVFYTARAKHFIEIRPADSVPASFIYAYIALIEGLFYNKNNLEKLDLQLKNYQNETYYEHLISTLMVKGKDAEVFGERVWVFCENLCVLAKEGLTQEKKADAFWLTQLLGLCQKQMSVGEYYFTETVRRNAK